MTVFCMAKNVFYVRYLGDGCEVEDSLFTALAHDFYVVWFTRLIQGVVDGQSSSLTVTTQLEGLSQKQRTSHHRQHRL